MGNFSRISLNVDTTFQVRFGHGLLISQQVVDEQPNDRLFLQVRRWIVLF
jgi:hypothetical protein